MRFQDLQHRQFLSLELFTFVSQEKGGSNQENSTDRGLHDRVKISA